MYLDYFGLDRDPFTISPDPAFLYPSPQHKQALAHLKYGLDRAGGFILLTGEVGTGKTTLTRLLLEQLAGNVRVAYILNAKLDSSDVLASICQELGLEVSNKDIGLSIKALTDKINANLLEAHTQGKKTLVVIEEAQNLDPDVLETLRLLTNLETNTTKLLHILLVGQPELLELISRNELRQLNQRVVSRFHIDPLGVEETKHYIAHRLRRAGCKRSLFDSVAIIKLHSLSGGIPRILNLIAERSLLGAYATGERIVTASLVKNATQEVFGNSPVLTKKNGDSSEESTLGFPIKLIFGLLICIALAVILFFYFPLNKVLSTKVEVADVETIFEVPSNNSFAAETDDASIPMADFSREENLQEGQVVTFETVSEQEGNYRLGLDREVSTNDAVYSQNAFERLLDKWGIEERINNVTGFCDLAESSGLSCQIDEAIELNELYEINRPAIVSLQVSPENSTQYVLVSLANGMAQLENSSGSYSISIDIFVEQWNQTAVYLWRPPFNYTGLLIPSKKDSSAVAWVQEQLSYIYPEYEYIIAGGFYSQAIVEFIMDFQSQQNLKADGLIGPRTILRLMDQTETLPQLSVFSLDELLQGQDVSPIGDREESL